jgi:hypothetical protein
MEGTSIKLPSKKQSFHFPMPFQFPISLLFFPPLDFILIPFSLSHPKSPSHHPPASHRKTVLRLARALQAMQRMSEAMRLLHHERRNFPECSEMQRLHEATRLALRALDGVGVVVGVGPVVCVFLGLGDWRNETGHVESWKSIWLAARFFWGHRNGNGSSKKWRRTVGFWGRSSRSWGG